MNQLDSELVAEILRASGATLVDHSADADVLLFITCSVRAHAENRVFSNIGKLKMRKAREPHLVVGLLGCMAQQYGRAVRERAPLVDVVCAPSRLAELPALIAQARAGQFAVALDPNRAPQAGRLTVNDDALDEASVRRPLLGSSPGQAYVVAMRGCDNFCSYCVVPHVRGPERSRPPRVVLDEVRRLVGQGARQITFLGQAVDKYRAEEDGCTWDLADLLAEAAQVPGLVRLSFITNHPRALDERLASVFRDVPQVIPYLHMPAQSGSDAVLARMNRGYTHSQYLERVALVRSMRPDVAVASDFIVGFPGETDDDFRATVDLVRRARFTQAFVFKYSPRPGTIAAERLEDDVPDPVKRRRNNDLLALIEEVAGEENKKYVGQVLRVFVEELAPRPRLNKNVSQAGWLTESSTPHSALRIPHLVQLRGRAPTNHIVVFDGPPELIGTEVDVRIDDATPLTLFGTLLAQ
jgi:tRNA-2-methylthio-N6-dimethylallyladenosine synthase